jgi:hypothetical protein
MHSMALLLAFTAGMAAPSWVLAESAATPAPAPSAPARPSRVDPDRIVCARERVVGSHRPRKVCMTMAQREAYREQARRALDETRRGLGSRDVMNGGDGRGGGRPL